MPCLLVSRILSTNESDGFDFLAGAASANFFNSFNFRMTFMKQDKNLTTMRKVKMLLAAMLMPLAALAQTVASPDGNVVLNFSLDNGRPTYQLDYKGKAVVKPSHLGLELARDKHASKGLEETDLMDGFTIVKTDTSSFDETWKPVWGETATIRNNYKEMAVTLNQPATKRNIVIRFRVYNDGMGLRYEFPQQNELNYFIIKGSTHSLQWPATIRLGGYPATMTRRSMTTPSLAFQRYVD